eukprot:15472242-Alexandrium_andersonii.AAC.1
MGQGDAQSPKNNTPTETVRPRQPLRKALLARAPDALWGDPGGRSPLGEEGGRGALGALPAPLPARFRCW